jgi:hypothetical protein
MSLGNLSPYWHWRLPRNGNRFLGGFQRVLLSPRAQFFRDRVIATVVCGGGGRMGVRGVDMQIRSIVMVALGHSVLHIPLGVFALSSGVSHLPIPGAGQSNTAQPAPRFASTKAALMDDRQGSERLELSATTLPIKEFLIIRGVRLWIRQKPLHFEEPRSWDWSLFAGQPLLRLVARLHLGNSGIRYWGLHLNLGDKPGARDCPSSLRSRANRNAEQLCAAPAATPPESVAPCI